MNDLKEAGLEVEVAFSSQDHQFVIVKNYVIKAGRFQGESIDIAVPAPADYPASAPSGLYPNKKLVAAGALQVHDFSQQVQSLPQGEWLYWSRPLPPGSWTQHEGGKRLKAHWTMVFNDPKLNEI